MATPSGGFNHFPAIMRELERYTGLVVRTAAFNIAARAKESMEGAKSGRDYRIAGVTGGMHRASAPGEAPAILYGQLHNSIDVIVKSPSLALVVSYDEKAPWEEFGTTRMAPRPFMAPAAEREREPYVAAMNAAIRKASQS